MSKTSLEFQIEILEKKLACEPEKINGCWNQRHFALKNKIKTLKARLIKFSRYKSWNDYLAK